MGTENTLSLGLMLRVPEVKAFHTQFQIQAFFFFFYFNTDIFAENICKVIFF